MRYFLALLLAVAGCDAVGPLPTPGAGDTGLVGVVVRGPMQPVCGPSLPCEPDAPFAAGFTVRRDGRPVGTFRTADDGRFAIRLAPGTYSVQPDADAPVFGAAQQSQTATVGPSGLTSVTLAFDTGIR